MYHVEERSEGLPLQTQKIYFTSYINVNVKWAVLSARRGRTKQVSFAGGPSAKLYWNIKPMTPMRNFRLKENYCSSLLRQAGKVQDFPVSPSLLESLFRTELGLNY